MNIFLLVVILSLMDIDTADEILASKDMTRAQRRHNTAVAIAKKKAKKTCRKGSGNWCPQPWWNVLDEEGNTEKPHLGKKQSGNKQHKAQQHRWDTYTYSSKRNTWKKEYDAFEIERRNLFDKVDVIEERKDVFSDEDISSMWDSLTGEEERIHKEKFEALLKERDKAKELVEKFEEENKETLEKFFDLRDKLNNLEEAVYFFDK